MANKRLFQAIDFDRTLFDTVRFVDEIILRISMFDPVVAQEIDVRFKESYASEKSFFILQYIRERIGEAQSDVFIDEVIREYPDDHFLLPGARERLTAAPQLSNHTPSYGILTFGNAIDQILKVKIAGLDSVPLLITDTPHKSVVMKSWQNTDGTFTLPVEFGGGTVENIVLEDDKLKAFIDLPLGAKGIWLTDDPQADEQLKDMGTDVVAVRSLFESIDVLKATYL